MNSSHKIAVSQFKQDVKDIRSWNPGMAITNGDIILEYILELEEKVQKLERKISDASWGETHWGA